MEKDFFYDDNQNDDMEDVYSSSNNYYDSEIDLDDDFYELSNDILSDYSYDDNNNSDSMFSQSDKNDMFIVNFDDDGYDENYYMEPNKINDKYLNKNKNENIKETASQNKQIPITVKGKKGKSKLLTAFFIIAVCVAGSILIASFAMSCVNDMLGILKENKKVVVNIPENADTNQVAEILETNGLIDQKVFFKAFINLKAQQKNEDPDDYLSGNFELNPKDGYEGMRSALKFAKEDEEDIKITFPEGITINGIIEKLEEYNVCSRDDFLQAMEEYPLESSPVLKDINTENKFYKLEGFLFPDTYNFYRNENPTSVIKRFITAFEKRFGTELRNAAEEQGMSIDEVVTLASMIESETNNIYEMGKVSGVFRNRLDTDDPKIKTLGSDACRDYYLEEIAPHLSSESEKERYSKLYSTYDMQGLPPGAICSPGIDCLNAALYPERTHENYGTIYYFLMDKKGKHYYARTQSQHNSNIKKMEKVNAAYDQSNS